MPAGRLKRSQNGKLLTRAGKFNPCDCCDSGSCCRNYGGNQCGVPAEGDGFIFCVTSHITSGLFGVKPDPFSPAIECGPWSNVNDAYTFWLSSFDGECPNPVIWTRSTRVDPDFHYPGATLNGYVFSQTRYDHTGSSLIGLPPSDWFGLNPNRHLGFDVPYLEGSIVMPPTPIPLPFYTSFDWQVDLSTGICAVSTQILQTRTNAQWSSAWGAWTVNQRSAHAEISVEFDDCNAAVHFSGTIDYDIEQFGTRYYGHFDVQELTVAVSGLVSC